MWLLDKFFRRTIRRGRLTVTDHDGRTYRYGESSAEPALAIRFTDAKAADSIARRPQIGAGEAYMDGRLVVEPPHDIRDLIDLVTSGARLGGMKLEPKGSLRRSADRLAAWLDQRNHRARSSKNVAHHYELGRQFYELFLDEDRQYSMAYWHDPAGSLEQAQVDKKALIAAKLHLPEDASGLRVLDIGCGWGGFALFLARHYGCQVLGISLAPDQVRFATERAEAAGLADKVKFQVIDYRDLGGTFDRISSIGMLEHVGARYFGEYFAKTGRLLADDGVMLTHTIGRAEPPGRTDKWTRKYIFPGGYVPALSELVTALEDTRWEITDVEILRYHYALTLAEWYRRAGKHQAEIEAMYDARFYRMWRFYLAGSESSFRHGGLVNFHIQSTRRRDTLPPTRDYIAREFARLRQAEPAPDWHLAGSRPA